MSEFFGAFLLAIGIMGSIFLIWQKGSQERKWNQCVEELGYERCHKLHTTCT